MSDQPIPEPGSGPKRGWWYGESPMSDQPLDDKLKPCPFCGGTAAMLTLRDCNSPYRTVKCSHCACGMHWYPTEEMAIEKWNRRHNR